MVSSQFLLTTFLTYLSVSNICDGQKLGRNKIQTARQALAEPTELFTQIEKNAIGVVKPEILQAINHVHSTDKRNQNNSNINDTKEIKPDENGQTLQIELGERMENSKFKQGDSLKKNTLSSNLKSELVAKDIPKTARKHTPIRPALENGKQLKKSSSTKQKIGSQIVIAEQLHFKKDQPKQEAPKSPKTNLESKPNSVSNAKEEKDLHKNSTILNKPHLNKLLMEHQILQNTTATGNREIKYELKTPKRHDFKIKRAMPHKNVPSQMKIEKETYMEHGTENGEKLKLTQTAGIRNGEKLKQIQKAGIKNGEKLKQTEKAGTKVGERLKQTQKLDKERIHSDDGDSFEIKNKESLSSNKAGQNENHNEQYKKPPQPEQAKQHERQLSSPELHNVPKSGSKAGTINVVTTKTPEIISQKETGKLIHKTNPQQVKDSDDNNHKDVPITKITQHEIVILKPKLQVYGKTDKTKNHANHQNAIFQQEPEEKHKKPKPKPDVPKKPKSVFTKQKNSKNLTTVAPKSVAQETNEKLRKTEQHKPQDKDITGVDGSHNIVAQDILKTEKNNKLSSSTDDKRKMKTIPNVTIKENTKNSIRNSSKPSVTSVKEKTENMSKIQLSSEKTQQTSVYSARESYSSALVLVSLALIVSTVLLTIVGVYFRKINFARRPFYIGHSLLENEDEVPLFNRETYDAYHNDIDGYESWKSLRN